MASNTKDLSLAPLTGVLDLRSSPDSLPQGAVRMRQNFQTTGEGKLRRGTGFQKFLSPTDIAVEYNNEDFHDQLLLFGSRIRQPVTLLYPATSMRQVRSLFLANQSCIARLNEYSGNYKILGTGFGGVPATSASAPRFKAACLGDYLAFTNDFDKPKYHILEQTGIEGESLYEFDDFDLIGLRRARCVWSFANCLFFANVEMDSQRYGNRILWSNYANPTSFDPAKQASITGYYDLYPHETILAGEVLGNVFLIYTTHGIWEMSVIGGAQSFAFRRVYSAEKNENSGVLAFPNMLVNLGDVHLFADQDGLNVFSPLYANPDRPEWLHRATTLLFDNIDATNCEVHVGGLNGDEVMFSIAEVDEENECPNVSLRINTSYKTCDVVDHGFTAFCNYSPQRTPTIRDFIIENGICTVEGLTALGHGYVFEGLPRPMFELPDGFVGPNHIYTDQTVDVDGVLVEDWTQPAASSDSLCALLDGEILDDICKACKSEAKWVAASSQDWCLKQLGGVFYREICQNPEGLGIEHFLAPPAD